MCKRGCDRGCVGPTGHDYEWLGQQAVAARPAVAQFEVVQGVGPEAGHLGLALVPQGVGVRGGDLGER